MSKIDEFRTKNFDDIKASFLSYDDYLKNESLHISKEYPEAGYLLTHTFNNIFINSPGGSGKSHLAKEYKKYMFANYPDINIATIAPTGIAASNVEGKTMHSYFKININKILKKENNPDVEKLPKNLDIIKTPVTQDIADDILIIDEFSMLTNTLFNYIYEWFFKTKGGKNARIIMIGDSLQLPPIIKGDEDDTVFYETNKFRNLFFKKIVLDKNMRSKDDLMYTELLKKVRIGEINQDIKKKLTERNNLKLDSNHSIPVLFNNNADCDKYNKDKLTALEKIHGKVISKREIEYCIMPDKYSGDGDKHRRKKLMDYSSFSENRKKDKLEEILNKNEFLQRRLPETLELSNDCIIMHTINTSPELCNGKIGKSSFEGEELIMTINEKKFKIKKVVVYIDINEDTYYNKMDIGANISYISVTQYPLILAFAITVHKSQSLTYDSLIIDMTKWRYKTHALLYVALSRCRSYKNLYLINYHDMYVYGIVNKSSLDFYNKCIKLWSNTKSKLLISEDNKNNGEN